jgi:hypothetical protein
VQAFREARTAFSKPAATTQVDEHITAHYPTPPTLTQALKRTVAGWCSEAARFRMRICPCPMASMRARVAEQQAKDDAKKANKQAANAKAEQNKWRKKAQCVRACVTCVRDVRSFLVSCFVFSVGTIGCGCRGGGAGGGGGCRGDGLL